MLSFAAPTLSILSLGYLLLGKLPLVSWNYAFGICFLLFVFWFVGFTCKPRSMSIILQGFGGKIPLRPSGLNGNQVKKWLLYFTNANWRERKFVRMKTALLRTDVPRSQHTVDEVHPANSVMYEGACGRPLIQPMHGFPDCMLQINACFLVFSRAWETLPCYINGWVPHDKDK